MKRDIWHYPREKLAHQLLGMFGSGLSTSLIFFAPRRMGKTEFLRKDILPLAEKEGWHTFYFSFLEVNRNAEEMFCGVLTEFISKNKISNVTKSLAKRVRKVSGNIGSVGGEIELNYHKNVKFSINNLIEKLSKNGKTLLLLDEIQVLAKYKKNESFVAALRTALDMYKDNVKVIFTGSSQEGLRQMFSQASAPFFHFGQNLPFPKFGREFSDHLVSVFEKVTSQKLNAEKLWKSFQEMGQVPQLIRSLVERLILHTNITIEECTKQLLSDVTENRLYVEKWKKSSGLERVILLLIANKSESFFSVETRLEIAKKLGVELIGVSSVQSVIRALLKKGLIGRSTERGAYFIDDPNFQRWLKTRNE